MKLSKRSLIAAIIVAGTAFMVVFIIARVVPYIHRKDQTRMVHFPWLYLPAARLSFLEKGADPSYSKNLGFAWGTVAVPVEGDLSVEILRDDHTKPLIQPRLSFLSRLKPDDIQSIGIFGVRIRDDDLAKIKGLTGLKALFLDGGITDKGLGHIQKLTSLETLGLAGADVTDAGLFHLRNLPSLRQLGLTGTKITDAGVSYLENLSSLEELHLTGTKITDAGLSHLESLSSLEKLYLEKTSISDEGLKHLKNLSSLRRLYISDTQVTGSGLGHLKSMNLLERLDLSRTRLNDMGMAQLGELTSIIELFMQDTRITDVGLLELKNMTSLEYLYLPGTDISDAGVKAINQYLPNCQVRH